MPHAVIGSSGLVGQALADRLEAEGKTVVRHCRPAFDLTKPETYADLDFTGMFLLDCAACVDGSPEEIYAVNVAGLSALLQHCDANPPARYIYFSTSATLSKEHVETNPYVRSKFEGEKLVLARDWGKVIRLTFPFGAGESPNRLVTRLINKALRGESIQVCDVRLPLTPLRLLEENLDDLLRNSKKEQNPTDGKTYLLAAVVDVIFQGLGMAPNYVADPSNTCDFGAIAQDVFPSAIDALQEIRAMAALKSHIADAG